MTARPNLPASAASFAAQIPYAFAKAHGVLAAGMEGDAVVVLTRPDATADGVIEIKRVLQRPLVTRAIGAEEFSLELARAYNQAPSGASTLVDDLTRETDLSRLMQDLPATEDLLDSTTQAPVIRMINALLLQALRERASDLHFEPYETRSVVRFRVDGVLRDVIEPPRALHAALVSRLKIMASLDIAEKRLPQDGRISLKLGDKAVDVRMSTLPTGPGERVVLRLLDKESARLDLTTLGMGERTREVIDRLIREPHGILLVTGPTGSGKTTTLYAALSRLPRGSVNMMTVEDPIEYALDGVAQTQVNPRIELDFARTLRAMLRQDPDVMMIGEIRDLETAQIAVQASLTGHLVLATLHTNDATSAVTRLADMGVEPYLLASSLLGVLAQRLVRTLCPVCRVAQAATSGEQELTADLGLSPDTPVWHAPGCDACGGSGFRGRTGVYELLVIDDAIRRHIHDGTADHALRDAAARAGMVSLRHDGARYIADGTTRCRTASRSLLGPPRAYSARTQCDSTTMSAFRFEAVDGQGRLQQGVLEAASPRAVRDLLRADGLTPTAITAATSVSDRLTGVRLPAPLLALTTRQLATLALSGLPLDQALSAVAEQADDARAMRLATELRTQIAAGESLPAALARYPRAFSPLYRGLVAAGAETGRLAEVLARLADYLEAREALRQKITLALIYPAVVTVIALSVIGVLLVYVVPQVVSVYQQSRQTLPWLTQALIATSNFFRATGWLWLVAAVAGFAAFAFALRRPAVRARWHAFLLRLPVSGRLLRSLDTARFASTLAILVGSGAPLLRSLDAAAEVVRMLPLRAAASATTVLVREGVALSRALREQKVFPPVLIHLVGSGEQSGRLAPMLERAAEELERDAERRLAWLAALLQPALIVVMGAIVLVLVLAVMLPIVSMNQLIR